MLFYNVGVGRKEPKKEANFVTVHIAVDGWDAMAWDARNTLTARFADDKTVIPMSAGYDGNLFATIPATEVTRMIEGFHLTTVEKFPDENDSGWQYYTMRDPIALGIMSTDADGNALPFETVTMADAVTALMKLLSFIV